MTAAEPLGRPRHEVPTERSQLDADLQTLAEHKHEWAELGIPRKVEFLEQIIERTDLAAQRWVDLAVEGKQLPPASAWVGEEWVTGPWSVIYACQALAQTLRSLASGGLPEFPNVRALPDGRAAVQVFPVSTYDAVLLSGYSAEVWMQEGVTPETLKDNVARFYRGDGDEQGKVSVVLGAGNVTSIPPLDALYRLFVMGQVTIVKLNPVNAWLGPVFEDVFDPLVTAGYIRFVYGGGEVGRHLTHHELTDELHLTGSESTYDRIVFGAGDEGRARKERDEPELDKPFTAELGGVGPVLVIPGGPWSDADLAFHAEGIVSAKLHNSGHNCAAAQVLVLPRDWEHADALEQAVKDLLASLVPRQPWYPGAGDRQSAAAERHESHLTYGGEIPATILADVDPDDDHFAFKEEFFSVVFAVTRLPGKTPEEFWENAVKFANEKLHGTLGANVIVHPRVKKEMGDAFHRGLVDLRYGAVGVNVWNAAAYMLPYCTWGAYPGHPRNAIESGTGVVHNAFMFDRPRKTVVSGPFAPSPRTWVKGEFHLSPKPLWYVTNEKAHLIGERITRFQADPSVAHLPGIFAAALRG